MWQKKFHNRERDRDRSDLVYGKWPVREALMSRTVSKIFILHGAKSHVVDEIFLLARQKKIPFHMMERMLMDKMVDGVHQGVIAQVAPLSYVGLDKVISKALSSSFMGPRLLFLDGVTDPQNLGSILRSAVYFGVPGVVIPKWRSAHVTASVVRASAGAAQFIDVAQVSNLVQAIEEAKKAGLWLLGAEMEGDDVKSAEIPRPFGLVLGSEGKGLHDLVRKKCDKTLKISKIGACTGVDSLNVGSACAVMLHQLSS